MRRRPQPNRRRGLLRAAGVAIVLIVVLAAAMLIISSLTAPKVVAPTPPPTPHPFVPTVGIGHVPTPGATGVPRGAPTSPARPHLPTPQTTHRPTRDTALGGAAFKLYEHHPSAALIARAAQSAAATNPSWRFGGTGDAYLGRVLHVRTVAGESAIGRADPYVRPVWSPDGRHLLYVRVRGTSTYPGAIWTLFRYDVLTNRSQALVSRAAMNLSPLGWSTGRILYLVASSTDTSIYSVTTSGPRFLSILITQPITSGLLSPNGSWIAFAAPGSCSYCTLDLFSLDDFTIWNGPSGLPGEYAMTWTRDSQALVAAVGGELITISPDGHDISRFVLPTPLASSWVHPMRALVDDTHVRLTDLITRKVYLAPEGLTVR